MSAATLVAMIGDLETQLNAAEVEITSLKQAVESKEVVVQTKTTEVKIAWDLMKGMGEKIAMYEGEIASLKQENERLRAAQKNMIEIPTFGSVSVEEEPIVSPFIGKKKKSKHAKKAAESKDVEPAQEAKVVAAEPIDVAPEKDAQSIATVSSDAEVVAFPVMKKAVAARVALDKKFCEYDNVTWGIYTCVTTAESTPEKMRYESVSYPFKGTTLSRIINEEQLYAALQYFSEYMLKSESLKKDTVYFFFEHDTDEACTNWRGEFFEGQFQVRYNPELNVIFEKENKNVYVRTFYKDAHKIGEFNIGNVLKTPACLDAGMEYIFKRFLNCPDTRARFNEVQFEKKR